jgi:hypothetical protein
MKNYIGPALYVILLPIIAILAAIVYVGAWCVRFWQALRRVINDT